MAVRALELAKSLQDLGADSCVVLTVPLLSFWTCVPVPSSLQSLGREGSRVPELVEAGVFASLEEFQISAPVVRAVVVFVVHGVSGRHAAAV